MRWGHFVSDCTLIVPAVKFASSAPYRTRGGRFTAGLTRTRASFACCLIPHSSGSAAQGSAVGAIVPPTAWQMESWGNRTRCRAPPSRVSASAEARRRRVRGSRFGSCRESPGADAGLQDLPPRVPHRTLRLERCQNTRFDPGYDLRCDPWLCSAWSPPFTLEFSSVG